MEGQPGASSYLQRAQYLGCLCRLRQHKTRKSKHGALKGCRKLSSLDFAYALNPDCLPVDGSVEVKTTTEPAHGAVEVVAGDDFPDFAKTNIRFKCNDKRTRGFFINTNQTEDTSGLISLYPSGLAREVNYNINGVEKAKPVCVGARARHLGGAVFKRLAGGIQMRSIAIVSLFAVLTGAAQAEIICTQHGGCHETGTEAHLRRRRWRQSK